LFTDPHQGNTHRLHLNTRLVFSRGHSGAHANLDGHT
jgi:hypothetical protein